MKTHLRVPQIGEVIWAKLHDKSGGLAIHVESTKNQDPTRPEQGSITGIVLKHNADLNERLEIGSTFTVENQKIYRVENYQIFKYNEQLLDAVHKDSFLEIIETIDSIEDRPEVPIPPLISSQVTVKAARSHPRGVTLLVEKDNRFTNLFLKDGKMIQVQNRGPGGTSGSAAATLMMAAFTNENLLNLILKGQLKSQSMVEINQWQLNFEDMILPEEFDQAAKKIKNDLQAEMGKV